MSAIPAAATAGAAAGAGAALSALGVSAKVPAVLRLDSMSASAGPGAMLRSGSLGGGMPFLVCHYNPETLAITGGATWDESGSTQTNLRGWSFLVYKNTKARTLAVKLHFDKFHEPFGDVQAELDTLQTWSEPEPLDSDVYRSPRLRFQWGPKMYFKCVLSEYTITHTMFSAMGLPVRAEVNITLTEYKEKMPGTNPTSGGEGGERVRTVIAGDTLHSIAQGAYGDAAMWRGIAAFNGVEDPRRLATGTELALPTRDVVEALS